MFAPGTWSLPVILVGLLLFSMALGLPVAFALGGSATVFLLIFWGWTGVNTAFLKVWTGMNTFVLAAIPLFIFMGIILERSGIAEELYDAVHKWLGGLRGGLAIGTIIICAIFAACTGITGAATVTMGYIALPAMLKRGYKKDLALGAVTGGGTLGPLIPPSVNFVFIGLFGLTSIGGLFAAGVFSGLLVAILMIIGIFIRCYFIDPELGPGVPPEERASWREKFVSLRGLILPILLIMAVLGSIVSGAATPTEGAGIGAFGSLLCAAVHRKLSWQVFKQSTLRAFRVSVYIMIIAYGAFAFNGAFAKSGGAPLVTDVILGVPGGRWAPVIAMMVLILILGTFMELSPVTMIMAPIMFPIIRALGFSDIWFGTLWCIAGLTGFISPPFGYNLFYMRGIVPDIDPTITMGNIYRSVIPYVIALVSGGIIIMLFPPIATWLPSVLFRGFK